MTTDSHAPDGYQCPFCRIAAGVEEPDRGTKQRDVVYQDRRVTVFVANKWWPNNKGHVMIIPNQHFENLYVLPDDYAIDIHRAAKLVARAMKAEYSCQGISTRQHNEPAGNQIVWHYHLHVFPRYANDDLYASTGYYTDPEERVPYASQLREWIGRHRSATEPPERS
jgi:histidine triad (HIT) family protein